MSGGQQQLAIARALLQRPQVMILDEPNEGIQPSIIKDIERVIRLLRQRGEVVAAGSQAQMASDDVTRHLSV